nr:MAG TPA_asm: hypothetical protein [Caudoviricetes sp.]
MLKRWFSQAGLHPRKGIGSSPICEQKNQKIELWKNTKN